ncbi:putative selenate ABC transporter substrate-binding protein [Reinekea sp.]|uniref:putative selenate ABC transporter substrate-binding protein n=1 Tax=Reinekea sp. TaxID=1970455 RepID=UPI002A83E08B|nr:putative selenate ABC transporter substrate-binding protein [Reinekea sp.]
MFPLSRVIISAALLLTVSLMVQAETFTFTAIPDADASRLQERFDKVADYLSAELGVEVKYIPVKSYAAAITAFRNNQVQLAWFGGLSGVQARRLVVNSEAIAQGYEDQLFKTYFIAHHSTGMTAAETFPLGIEGKTFTFGSKGSTSGRLMPEFHIREQFKMAPEQAFARVGYSGDHSRTIAQVQAGAYQVGAVNYQVWETELASGKIDPTKVSVIWSTPTYPDYQWTIRGDVDARYGGNFKQRVTQALLNMSDPNLLASFPRQSFLPASNQDYAPIENTAQAIGLLD